MHCEAEDIRVTSLNVPAIPTFSDFLVVSQLRADDRGLAIDGQHRFARDQLRSTHLQRLPDGRVAACFKTSLLSVRLTLVDEPTARAVCAELGANVEAILPEGVMVARYFGSAATRSEVLASFLGTIVVMVVGGVMTMGSLAFFATVASMGALGFFGWSALLELSVGVDGVAVRRRGRSRFVPFENIASIDAHPEAVALVLRSGETIHVHIPFAETSPDLQRMRERMMENLTASLRAYVQTATELERPRVAAVALLARGERPLAEWLVALKDLATSNGSAYRSAEVPLEELWRVVEDVSADPTARAGAAVALRSTLDDSGRTRLRVASEGTASKIRVVLEAVTAEDETALESALAEVADEAAAT